MLDLRRRFSHPPRPHASKTTRPGLEQLEDRTVPALVTYDAATDALHMVGDLGDSDTVFITAPAANQVLIQVTGGDTLTLGGDALGSLDFVLSPDATSLTIHTEPILESPLAQLTVQLGDHNDTLVLGLADPAHNVGSITVDGEDGTDTVHLNALILPGNLTVAADLIVVHGDVAGTGTGAIALTADTTISLASNSGLATAEGNITLEANQGVTPAVGNSLGIRTNNAEITTVNGDILLKGRGGNDAATGLHAGINLAFGSTITSTGVGPDAGTIALVGTGGDGTSQNYGVVVEGAGSLVSSVDGAIAITGTGGNGSTFFNIGVLIFKGGQVVSTGTAPVTLTGTGGGGTDFNYGVDVDGLNSLVTSERGAIQINGTGGAATGQLNVGIVMINGGQVLSTGLDPDAATIALNGIGGGGTQFNVGIHLSGAATRVSTVAGAIELIGTATAEGASQHGILMVGATVITTGDASLTFNGTASAALGATGDGVLMLSGASVQSAGNGTVDFFGTAAGPTKAAIEWDSMTLNKTGGSVTFHGEARGQNLEVLPGPFNVAFLDGGDVTAAVEFQNSGGVTFGDNAGDVLNFHGGVTSTASPTVVFGKVQTSNDDVHLAEVTVTDGVLSAGTATLYLSGDVTWKASTVGGKMFGTIDLGGTRTFTVEDGAPDLDLTVNGPLANGALIKTGAGTLNLVAGGTYAGGTTVLEGTLRAHNANGSATGTGPVVVNGGSLAGGGTVAGPVQFLTGVVSPGETPLLTRTGSLTLAQGVEFQAVINAAYNKPGVNYDSLLVTGSVALNGATLALSGGDVAPTNGTYIWLIQNDGADPVSGIFAGLPEGSQVSVGNFAGRISYRGGDGNDVVLQVGSLNGPPNSDQQTNSTSVRRVIAVGSPVGFRPLVRVYDAATRKKLFQVRPYSRNFRGGVRVAVGDVNGDGVFDVVTVPGQGASSNMVKVYNGATGKLMGVFRAPKRLAGLSGVSVAVGAIDGDPHADIVLGSGRGAKAKVLAINGSNLKALKSYSVTGKRLPGGVKVRLLDLNGDGLMEIVT